jgi:hypothetical protein
MRSKEPPAAPGLIRNIISRQEATPSRQVCQENRLKVGLGWAERRKKENSGLALNKELPLALVPSQAPSASVLPIYPPSFTLGTQVS